MSRGFPSNVLTALASQHVALVTFAELQFPSGTVYLHNSIGTYTWGGHDWLGVGDLGEISQIEEGADVSPYKITLSLSGLDATISGAALTEDYYMHPVKVYLGVLDADDALLADDGSDECIRGREWWGCYRPYSRVRACAVRQGIQSQIHRHPITNRLLR